MSLTAYSSVPIKRTVFFIPYTVSKNTVRLIGTIEYNVFYRYVMLHPNYSTLLKYTI